MIGSDTADNINSFYFNKTHRVEFEEDSSTAGIYYQGFADFRYTSSAPKWRIKRIDSTNGKVSITWAKGNDARNNIWDDRESLDYS